MARQTIPQVGENGLYFSTPTNGETPGIKIDSEAWYTWLQAMATRSFAFSCAEGKLTARRELRHGTWYWYAYRSQAGHLRKTYLGKSEELTLVRLREVAQALASQEEAPQRSLPRQAAPPAPASSTTDTPSLYVLTTKISAPPLRTKMVTRARLLASMEAAMRGALTLVIAPAGWGKTTLLTTWHMTTHYRAWPLAWVSLDAGDNDPLRFWTAIISALNVTHAELGKAALTLLYTSPTPAIEMVLTSLLNALNHLPGDTILVLDDFHLIEAKEIYTALAFLIEYLPSNLHLVIASRSDLLLPLARLRIRGALTEIQAEHLRFTPEEATTFLREVMGLSLSLSQVTALQVRTEGWIAGLQLAALSMQGRDNLADFIAGFTGSHRYVVDYLLEEVLSGQTKSTQDFLVQTCVLERLSGPLCDALLLRDDSQAQLRHLERNNLFLVPLDNERRWYRYHHLFAEVLRSRLQQQQTPAIITELHRRASAWYEQHELFDEAVSHALAIPDAAYAARLIEQYAWSTHFPSQFQVLLGWLNRLPDALVRTQASLALMHAITLMLTYQLDRASARVQEAECCLQEEMPAEQRRTILSLIAAFRANLARLFGDYEQAIPLAQRARALLPPQDMFSLTRMFRPSTIVTAASTYLADGRVTPEVEGQVEAALVAVRALGNVPTTIRSISNLARLQLLCGRLHRVEAVIEQVRQLVPDEKKLHTILNGADYYVLHGDLLREWNQLDQAKSYLIQGIELVKDTMAADAEMITRGYLALARLHYARGNTEQAMETLEVFARVAHQSHFATPLLAQGEALRVQFELARGNLEAAARWASAHSFSLDEAPGYPREQEYLSLIRVYIARGKLDPKGPFLAQACSLLDWLARDAEEKARMRCTLELLVLRVLMLQTRGELAEAVKILGQALTLAETEGYMRLFLDEGPQLLDLLPHVAIRGIAPHYTATLLNVYEQCAGAGASALAGKLHPLEKILTPREYEVLQLLLDGASNREIAERLVLSVNTVKKHILNICGKLGVQNRVQVMAKARSFL